MSKRERLTDRSKSYIRETNAGQTPAQIAARWGIQESIVRMALGQLGRRGYLPPLPEDEEAAEVERKRLIKRASKKRENSNPIGADIQIPREKLRMQCFAHWRDLDKHHPSGWASYKIETGDYTTKIRPSFADTSSMVGSIAAMCAHG